MTRETHPFLRALLLHQSKLFLGAVLLMVGAMLIREVWWAAVLLAVGVFTIGYGVFRMLRVMQHERPAFAHPIPSDLPFEDRIRIVRRGLWLMPLMFVPLSAWVAWDLFRLETGRVAEISLWSVIGDIYRYYGFWPAVLFAPVGTILFEVFLLLGLRQLERQAAEASEREGAR